MVKTSALWTVLAAGLAICASGCTSSLWGNSGIGSTKTQSYDQYSKDYQNRSVVAPGMGLDNNLEPSAMQKAGAAVAAVPGEIGNGFKSAGSKVSGWFTPSSTTTNVDGSTTTTTSIFAPKKEASPHLHVETARLYERTGNYTEAAKQYELALKQTPNDVAILLSYAHLLDHENKLPEATKMYERAVKANPREPATYNDLGLCLARRGMVGDATKALAKAAELQPDRDLYRNNLASLLIEQHRTDEALAQLRSVHNESVANYNLGVLLEQHQQDNLAAVHFQRAADLNPEFKEAREWVEKLAMRNSGQVPIAGFGVQPAPERVAAIPAPNRREGSYNSGQQMFAQPNGMQSNYRVASDAFPAESAYSVPANSGAGYQAPPQYSSPAEASLPPTPDNLGNYQPSTNSALNFQY